MAEIGEPIRRRVVIPAEEPVVAPTPNAPQPKPEKVPEKVPA